MAEIGVQLVNTKQWSSNSSLRGQGPLDLAESSEPCPHGRTLWILRLATYAARLCCTVTTPHTTHSFLVFSRPRGHRHHAQRALAFCSKLFETYWVLSCETILGLLLSSLRFIQLPTLSRQGMRGIQRLRHQWMSPSLWTRSRSCCKVAEAKAELPHIAKLSCPDEWCIHFFLSATSAIEKKNFTCILLKKTIVHKHWIGCSICLEDAGNDISKPLLTASVPWKPLVVGLWATSKPRSKGFAQVNRNSNGWFSELSCLKLGLWPCWQKKHMGVTLFCPCGDDFKFLQEQTRQQLPNFTPANHQRRAVDQGSTHKSQSPRCFDAHQCPLQCSSCLVTAAQRRPPCKDPTHILSGETPAQTQKRYRRMFPNSTNASSGLVRQVVDWCFPDFSAFGCFWILFSLLGCPNAVPFREAKWVWEGLREAIPQHAFLWKVLRSCLMLYKGRHGDEDHRHLSSCFPPKMSM